MHFAICGWCWWATTPAIPSIPVMTSWPSGCVETGLEENVLFTGRLEDEDLVVLLNRSDALVLPSFGEGFGLPAVEAAACGNAGSGDHGKSVAGTAG